MYPSAGGCDEFIRIFLYRQTVTREELESFKGRLTGDLETGEKITLKIVPLHELYRHAPDMKVTVLKSGRGRLSMISPGFECTVSL